MVSTQQKQKPKRLIDKSQTAMPKQEDISALKKKIAQLEHENAQNRMYLDAIYQYSDAGVFVVDVIDEEKFIFASISPAHERLTGLRADQVVGKTPQELHPYLPQESIDYILQLYKTCVASKKATETEGIGIVNNKKEWWLTRIHPSLNAKGKVDRLIGIGIIITKRKEAEDELKKSQEKIRSILETVPDIVLQITPTGIIEFINRTQPGFDKEAVVGSNVLDWFPQSGREKFSKAMQACLNTGDFVDLELHEGFGPNNQPAWYHSRFGPIIKEGEVMALTVVATDVTEHVLAQQNHVRIQRLQATGELSAGVSHNLNNLLTGILGPATLLKNMIDDPDQCTEIETIIDAGIRAQELVHRLHESTRESNQTTSQAVDINALIENAVRATRPKWKDKPEAQGLAIDITTNLNDKPYVAGTESEFYDIVVNLIFNAVEAMPTGGHISISTQTTNTQVQIIIQDTGQGMDAHTQKRIFEPFFTTRVDVGSGLGLSTVYNTLKRWQGHIEVASTPNKGTTFTIHLPLTSPPTSQTTQTTSPLQATTTPARILIVDDDANVSRVLSRLLTPHQVDIQSNPLTVRDQFRANTYDLIFIDQGMPKLPGNQLAAHLRQLDPAPALILITGWELNIQAPEFSAFDFQLQKPFGDMESLLKIVSQAIAICHERRQNTQ